jgi:hypothetical protein
MQIAHLIVVCVWLAAAMGKEATLPVSMSSHGGLLEHPVLQLNCLIAARCCGPTYSATPRIAIVTSYGTISDRRLRFGLRLGLGLRFGRRGGLRLPLPVFLVPDRAVLEFELQRTLR